MAYAIIKTGGRQYRVAEGDTIDVDLLEGDAGRKMIFGDVLMHADGEKITHGSPSVPGASAGFITRLIAFTSSVHRDSSRRSCFLPSGVSR